MTRGVGVGSLHCKILPHNARGHYGVSNQDLVFGGRIVIVRQMIDGPSESSEKLGVLREGGAKNEEFWGYT